jgi:HEAT repeat protein
MEIISNQSVENALISLSKLLKNACYYPDGHPSLNLAIDQAIKQFTQVLVSASTPIVFTIARQGFFIGKHQLDNKSPIIIALAQRLFYHKIKTLTFLPQLRDRHLLAFVRLIAQEPAVLALQGGIAELLDQQHISTIAVNELSLASVIKRQHSLDNTGGSVGAQRNTTNATPWLNAANDDIDRVARQLSIEELLQQLDAILHNPKTEQEQLFLKGLQQLTHIVQQKTTSADNAQVWIILKQIDVWLQNTSLPERYITVIKQAVNSLSKEELINLLIDQAIIPAQQTLARHLIPLMNAKTSTILSARLSTEPNHKIRKAISQILVDLGETAFPALLKNLEDERWFVVRNALSILAESRNEHLIPEFVKQLNHPEQRVVNETIRALARIKVPQSSQALIEQLESGRSDLPDKIILALGVLADPMAVAPLVKIAKQNDMKLINKGRTKAAIMALGEFGAPESTDTLIHLLQRIKIIKRKEYNEIRCQAATALGRFSDSKSLKALHQAGKSSQRQVAMAAKQALRQRGEV